MTRSLKLMCVLAHPDDESLGMGGTLAHYAGEGIETYLVTATRGERGRFYDNRHRPPLNEVGRTREAELLRAAEVLGIRTVSFLDYVDSDLDRADPGEAQGKIVDCIRQFRPDVVATFGPDGGYGHPDHIAISQLTTAAILRAADASFRTRSDAPAHGVSKFYFLAWSRKKWDAYQCALKKLVSRVDGVERQAEPWPDWAITTVIETADVWETVWRAVSCHKTQMSVYEQLEHLSDEHHRGLWGTQEFYRVFSTVNGGRDRETDLFAGLRAEDV